VVDQPIASFMTSWSSEKCVQDGYPSDWHLKWKRDVSLLAKSFCVGIRLMVKHFCGVSSLGMRAGYTSTNQNKSDKAWSGASLRPKPASGATMCRQSHVDFLLWLQWENLKLAIRQKRCALLMTGVCLLHDNVKPHTATTAVSNIEEPRFECIPHPPYSPDLTPSDFHIFGPLKDTLSGTQFWDDDEVQSAVHEWLRTRLKEFFSHGIYALVKRWCNCIELEGDHVQQ